MLNLLKKSKLVFLYLCMDELYTFAKKKDIKNLISFNFNLPKANRYYNDWEKATKKDLFEIPYQSK